MWFPTLKYEERVGTFSLKYFILIKTTAQTLEEFKAGGHNASTANEGGELSAVSKKEIKTGKLLEDCFGWYKGTISFKRVVQIPGTGKFQYQDTHFKARCKAHNPQECYDRIVEHLRSRQDVDMRSQFPSIKGKNFTCSYLGMNPEQEEVTNDRPE